MIDINIIRNNIDKLDQALKNRNSNIDISEIKDLDVTYRKFLIKLENLNNQKRIHSNNLATDIKNNVDKKEIESRKLELLELKKNIEEIEDKVNSINKKIQELLLVIPNIPHSSVPIGKSEEENIEIKKWKEPKKFNFNFKPHWDLANDLQICEFDRATKISGSRFVIYKNLGSKLIRALQSLTLDVHEQNGYIEYSMPLIVNEDSLKGTGQLPKFKEDLFSLENQNYFLSPTLEVQLTNLYRNEILDEKVLPIKITSSSLNFRSEAGSAGRDTRGIIRLHQFYKTEMVNLVHPDNSFEMLEKMTSQAEKILEILDLPYRRIVLCTGDMGFSSSKTYDIEVWIPSYNSYKEISSCSNCVDFQSRRSMIRFKNSKTNKNEYVHTLNGSGLAIDRLFAAVIENYQNEDGSISIPQALKKYLGFDKIEKI